MAHACALNSRKRRAPTAAGASPPCPTCAHRVPEGTWQTPYGCAPYVAHALVAGHYIQTPGVSDCGGIGEFDSILYHGHNYELNVVSKNDPNCPGDYCLLDFLLASGWTKTSAPEAGTVCAVTGSDGPYTHVIIGVGRNLCNAHNSAAYHVRCDGYTLNMCVNPPAKPPAEDW